MTKKLAVFSPFSNIWDHTYPEALITSGLSAEGWEVFYLNCDGALNAHCVAMSAANVDEFASASVRSQICKACHKRRDLATSHFGFDAHTIENYLTVEDARTINSLVESVTPESWTELEVDGFALGRYAIYEMWLNNKLVSTTLPNELWPKYLNQLRNTLLAYFASLRFLESVRPDATMVYNDHYSVNHAFSAAAEKLGIPSYSIHGGWHMVHRAESMSMMRSNYTMADVFNSTAWHSFKSRPLDPFHIELVSEHFEGLWSAHSAFAYSSKLEGKSAEELREAFGIQDSAKVILAAMSSEDELMGVQLIGVAPTSNSQKSLFSDQFEWVKYLLEFAKENTDYHLILRLHPRMFPNKRELKMSPVVAELMNLQEDLPSNISFNVPQDNIGLYDLVQIVDVLANFRSSVGAELMALGIPVVVPANSNFYTYPNELNQIAHTHEEFDELLKRSAATGWSLENSRKAFRWFAFLFNRVSVNFTETFTSRPNAMRPTKPGFRLWLWKKMVYVILQFGPLIREKLSLRRPPLPRTSIALFSDVLTNKLDSVSDSPLWPNISATSSEETVALKGFFQDLSTRQWHKITEPRSLAGQVKIFLNSSHVE
jgi:hypothetical protein